jgi:hypothetical protein
LPCDYDVVLEARCSIGSTTQCLDMRVMFYFFVYSHGHESTFLSLKLAFSLYFFGSHFIAHKNDRFFHETVRTEYGDTHKYCFLFFSILKFIF